MSRGGQTVRAAYEGSRALAASSLALALSITSLILFRGSMSIVSAMIVPSFLVLNLEITGRAYQIASIIALLIITVPFFQAQAIFVIAYIMIALVLKAAGGLGVHASMRILLFPFLVAAFALILFACLYLTEALLGVPLHRMMLRISRDDPAIYAGVLFLEAALVCTVNLLLIRVVAARLRILRTQPTMS